MNNLSAADKRALKRMGMKGLKFGGRMLGRAVRKRKRKRRRRRQRRNEQVHIAPVARAVNIRTVNSQARKTVVHREYIGEIYGSELFETHSFAINPGLPASFPWMWGLAGRYEHYQFSNLKFEYKPQAPTTATGALLMAIDYNVDDAAPTSKQQLLSYHGSSRCAPWTNQVMAASREGMQAKKPFLVRSSAVSDAKLYDTGNFFYATVGQADTQAIGELWISYSVVFSTPQSDQTVPSGWIHSSMDNTSGYDGFTGDWAVPLSSTSEGLPLKIVEYQGINCNYGLQADFTGTFFISITFLATEVGSTFSTPAEWITFPDGGGYAWVDDGEHWFATANTAGATDSLVYVTAIQLNTGNRIEFGTLGIGSPTSDGHVDIVISLMSSGLSYPEETVTTSSVARALALLQSTKAIQRKTRAERAPALLPLVPSAAPQLSPEVDDSKEDCV